MTDQSLKDGDPRHPIKVGTLGSTAHNQYEYTLSKFYSSDRLAEVITEDRCLPFEETESPVKRVTAQSNSTDGQERLGLLQSLKKCGDTFSPRRSIQTI